MAETDSDAVGAIGETAGLIWKALVEKGPLTLAKLIKAVGQPRDNVLYSVGWLAREDKIDIRDQRRSRIISLR
jgi:hypothetical protein